MNVTKTVCMLSAGALLAIAAPAFAERWPAASARSSHRPRLHVRPSSPSSGAREGRDTPGGRGAARGRRTSGVRRAASRGGTAGLRGPSRRRGAPGLRRAAVLRRAGLPGALLPSPAGTIGSQSARHDRRCGDRRRHRQSSGPWRRTSRRYGDRRCRRRHHRQRFLTLTSNPSTRAAAGRPFSFVAVAVLRNRICSKFIALDTDTQLDVVI